MAILFQNLTIKYIQNRLYYRLFFNILADTGGTGTVNVNGTVNGTVNSTVNVNINGTTANNFNDRDRILIPAAVKRDPA